MCEMKGKQIQLDEGCRTAAKGNPNSIYLSGLLAVIGPKGVKKRVSMPSVTDGSKHGLCHICDGCLRGTLPPSIKHVATLFATAGTGQALLFRPIS
uniref:Ovule protein n=1 Tax=Panagrellus redivivus TaxID=6233 RepID=A0A7E4ZV00_PANRE